MRSQEPRVLRAPIFRMLAGATTPTRSFCKFTNETRNGLEDSSRIPGSASSPCQRHRPAAATNCAGDRSLMLATTAPPLCLAGSGRCSVLRARWANARRRQAARCAATMPTSSAHRGRHQASAPSPGRLVDEIVPNSKLEGKVAGACQGICRRSKRKRLRPRHHACAAQPTIDDSGIRYGFVNVDIDRRRGSNHFDQAPSAPPSDIDGLVAQGASFWPLQVARELDDAILICASMNSNRDAAVQDHGMRPCGGCGRLPRRQQGALAGQQIRHYWSGC